MRDKKYSSKHTSWQHVSRWYNDRLGLKGDYYHRQLVIPSVLKLLNLKPNDSVLDLGCGQGILARNLPKDIVYCGIDAAQGLLGFAQKADHNERHSYIKGDITKPLVIPKKDFSHATAILALQNIVQPEVVIKNAAKHLGPGGYLVLVLNHPCFRIPRQSSWGIDNVNKIQYRRINRYLSPLKIPINMQPSRGFKGSLTWSFHFSLSSLSEFLYGAGFMIERLEEWTSDKTSVGQVARMENRARTEFPLFLAVKAKKYLANI